MELVSRLPRPGPRGAPHGLGTGQDGGQRALPVVVDAAAEPVSMPPAQLRLLQQASVASTSESGHYTCIKLTEHLDLQGIRPSIGTVGDAYENVLMESVIGLYKTECIRATSPTRCLPQHRRQSNESLPAGSTRSTIGGCTAVSAT